MTFADFDVRPGSATSVLRTIVGAFLRSVGGRIRASELVRLLETADIDTAAARTAISRVKARRLLLADTLGGQPGYRLNPEAVAMLERSDRRIFSYRQQGESDPWCLISFSVPESNRAARHQLRRRLGYIGAGTVADGLWITPGFLADEVRLILADLGLERSARLFVTERPESLETDAAHWWDLDHLANLHEEFLIATATIPDADEITSDAEAFARWVHAIDKWRIIPYLDPGLPASVLPPDWPGREAVERFAALREALAPRAHAFVESVVGEAVPFAGRH